MHLYKSIIQATIMLFVSIFFTACSNSNDAYDRGYREGQSYGYSNGYEAGEKSGYKSGYRQGNDDGYEHGKKDGYKKGYIDGTGFFIQDKALPTIGIVLLIIGAIIFLFYAFHYLYDPVKRKIASLIQYKELNGEVTALQTQIKKQFDSEKVNAKLRARITLSKLLCETSKTGAHLQAEHDLECIYYETVFSQIKKNYEDKKSLIVDLHDSDMPIAQKKELLQELEKNIT